MVRKALSGRKHNCSIILPVETRERLLKLAKRNERGLGAEIRVALNMYLERMDALDREGTDGA